MKTIDAIVFLIIILIILMGGCVSTQPTLDDPAKTKCSLPSSANPSNQTITRSYPYVVDGQQRSIELTLNQQWRDYFSCRSDELGPQAEKWTNVSKYDSFTGKWTNTSTYVDTELELINESKTYSALKPLVDAIKLKSPDPEMQARIVTSLVQQIPYNYTKQKCIDNQNSVLCHFDSPYEVLYSNAGQCAEKSTLLAGLLNELGYDSAIISFTGKHAMAGIGGSVTDQYQNTGYIAIETTSQEPIGWVSSDIGSVKEVKKVPGGGKIFVLNN
jgi:sarcosine oxidase delta subunit